MCVPAKKNTDQAQQLLSRGRLARSTIWSIFGNISPLLIAVPIIPILVDMLGTERFGVLSIIWVTIGYFSLFDLGIGRSLTKKVSDLIGDDLEGQVPVWSSAGFVLLTLLGTFAGVVVFFLAPFIVSKLLSIPSDFQSESLSAFLWVAFALPFVLGSTAFTGVLQAYQRFRPIAVVRVSLGAFMLFTPLALLQLYESLVPVIATLFFGRVLAWIALFYHCRTIMRGSSVFLRPTVREMNALLKFGGWLTVTNVIGPIMVYFDRFFVASFSGMQAVTFYTIPHDVLTKLGLVVGTYMSVIFPAFATATARHDRESRRIILSGFWFVGLTVMPAAVVLLLLAPELLQIWLGEDFAVQSAVAAQIIAAGVAINALARTPLTFIQARGRPDWSAKVHLLELPVYLLLLWWLVQVWGIEGAAVAWLVRVILDTWIFLYLAGVLLPSMSRLFKRIAVFGTFSVISLLFISLVSKDLFLVRFSVAAIISIIAAFYLLRHARKNFYALRAASRP